MATESESAMPPTVPKRHPARKLRSLKPNQSNHIDTLDPEHLDIWEHATLLYHGFEWQSAAETFLVLSRQINRNLESTLCQLNAAIIFARLGEFATASQILNEVEPEGDLLPLTMFLIGHVEFEQGNFDKSEECFDVALHSLNGPAQRYDHHGLDFTLRASHIQQNLRIFKTKNNLFGILGTIGAIPADGVFESPARQIDSGALSPVLSRRSTGSDGTPTLSDISSPASLAASPIDNQTELDTGDIWYHAIHRDQGDVITNDFEFEFEDAADPKRTLDTSPYPDSEPKVIGSMVRSLSQRQTPTIAPPQRTARKSLVPREARIQGDSVSNLANFIRHLPSQDRREPRSAEADPEPTADLAEFLKASDPLDTLKRRSTRRQSSDGGSSCYSQSVHEDSIRSFDLLTEAEAIERAGLRGAVPPPRRHPYRSGVGSALLRENRQSPSPARSSRLATSRSMILESANMDSESLHSFLCDGTSSDRDSTRSYAYTGEFGSASQRSLPRSSLSESVRSRTVSIADSPQNALHPALRSFPEVPIPSRVSSLKRSSPPPARSLRRVSNSPRPDTAASIITTDYSKLKPAPLNPSSKMKPRDDVGYSRFFGRFAGRGH